MGFPLLCLFGPSSRLLTSNSPSLCALTQQATHLVRRESSLVSLPPCLRFSPLPLCSNFFFLRFLCGSPTHCSVVPAPLRALIRSSRCLDSLRSLSLLHCPIFWLRIFSRPPPTPIIFFFVSFRFCFSCFLCRPPPTPAVLFAPVPCRLF